MAQEKQPSVCLFVRFSCLSQDEELETKKLQEVGLGVSSEEWWDLRHTGGNTPCPGQSDPMKIKENKRPKADSSSVQAKHNTAVHCWRHSVRAQGAPL